jgi:hypothetical protein
MPPVANRYTDVEIPRSAWSAWKEDGKPRQIRRPLSSEERNALELRRNEIAPVLAPHDARDVNRIALALTDMMGGYPSLRFRDDNAIAGRVDSVRRLLSDFPSWAIEKACREIHMNGVWRDGAFDRQWPPSDAELVDAVRQKSRLYRDTYNSAVELLTASVEEK